MKDFKQYFSGEKLYGDDFTNEEIEKWFAEEQEGYFGLIADQTGKSSGQKYQYHNLNKIHGFDLLPKDYGFEQVLGIGSAFGYEFLPIADRIGKLVIIEPSDNMKSVKLGTLSPEYVKPNVDGTLPFKDNTYNLVTCFGTLHHIPNVSHVIGEMIRVTKPGGFMLIREPVKTMGDWRHSRVGLTQNERGIPLHYFRNLWKKAGVEIVNEQLCESLFVLRPLTKLLKLTPGSIFYQQIDDVCSKLFSWNLTYHPTNIFQKLAPGSVFYVIRKK
jgi:SAM-dependent methyltransferase